MLNDAKLWEESLLFKTIGSSMFPFVREDDKVIVKKLRAQDLKIGDIILYKDDIAGRAICHRFIKRTNMEDRLILFTRGDSGSALSSPVPEDRLIGRVIGIIRKGRILNLRTKSQIILNWLNAKFYVFLKRILIFVFNILQSLSFYRKSLKRFFLNRIEYRQILGEDSEAVFDFEGFQGHKESGGKPSYQFEAVYKGLQTAFVALREEENSFCKSWWIYSLYVRTPFQGAGIAEKLMQRVMQFARDKKAPSLQLIVDESNVRALNFYRKLGFREVFRANPKIDIDAMSTSQITMRLEI
jgi:signal peptidase I